MLFPQWVVGLPCPKFSSLLNLKKSFWIRLKEKECGLVSPPALTIHQFSDDDDSSSSASVHG